MSLSEVHVAVAVILNQNNQVLISLRPQTAHQGGLWEFPGGKVESAESVLEALKREVFEELGLCITQAAPFKIIRHHYADKSVVLDVWKVVAFTGEPLGKEGQKIKWSGLNQLQADDFPAANRRIIQSLQLPENYMITGAFNDLAEFKSRLEGALQAGIKLLQLRCKKLPDADFLELVGIAQQICNNYSATLLVNTSAEIFAKTNAQGLHLTGKYLHELKRRPVNDMTLLSVSCHNTADIEQAKKLAADIILLSPVKPTKSHPGVKGIGWDKFSQLINAVDTPVYALGGMQSADMQDAKAAGAQGIAAISEFWGSFLAQSG